MNGHKHEKNERLELESFSWFDLRRFETELREKIAEALYPLGISMQEVNLKTNVHISISLDLDKVLATT